MANPGGIFEEKWRDNGGTISTLRLSAEASRIQRELSKRYGCNKRDVIEGLLLGNIRPYPADHISEACIARAMSEHRLSRVEALNFLHHEKEALDAAR